MHILKKIYEQFFHRYFLQGQVHKVILVAILLNLVFGVSFYFAEKELQPELSFESAIWWAMVTMTTVGYGDFYAQSKIGRFIISYPCMLLGIGIMGYLIGFIAENVFDRASKKRRGLMQIKNQNHIIICNFPNSEKIIRLIKEVTCNDEYDVSSFVLISNNIDELPEELSEMKVMFVKGDPTKEETLHRANIEQCSGVFVLAEDPKDPVSDTRTFAIGTIIEMLEIDLKRPIKVVVELVSKNNLKMMQRSNVDGIVSADGIMDGLLAQEFLSPGIHNIFHQIVTSAVGSQFYIFDTNLEGFKISDIQMTVLKAPTNLQVIGVCRNGEYQLNPPKTQIIEKGDKLIVLAEKKSDFKRIEKEILKT